MLYAALQREGSRPSRIRRSLLKYLAIEHLQMQAGSKLALSVPWQDIKSELAEAVDKVKAGYWARHRRNAPATAACESQPAALEVCFPASLTHQSIMLMHCLELTDCIPYILRVMTSKQNTVSGSKQSIL